MRIILFTSAKPVIQAFASVSRSKSYILDQLPLDAIRPTLRDVGPSTIAYVDITGVEADERKRLIKYLSSRETEIGIIDRNREVPDVADLFRVGFFDYLDKNLLKEGIKPARIKRFASTVASQDHPKTTRDPQWKLSGPGWKGVRAGQEYTFCFLYVELDLNNEWRSKSGRALIDDAMETFKVLLERAMSPYDGKIWMWMDLGGVVLFPFDGKPIGAVRACIRMVMDRIITSAEEYGYDTLITFRMAMHIGNTIYKSRGQTGTIVSDTINFVFHLGQQYAEPGGFYITDEVYPYVPEPLRIFFKSAGSFAERKIHRMRRPVNARA